jgi:hypothetical protein
MKTWAVILKTLTICIAFSLHANANDSTIPKISILLPISLQNYFDAKNKPAGNITKDAQPIIDYYSGVKIAAKELAKQGIKLQINVYEINATHTIQEIVKEPSFKGTVLLMGPLKEDLKQVAEMAGVLQIPFISTTSPSDAGVHGNQFFYMANPTLRVHIEEAYNYIKRNVDQKKWNNPNVTLLYAPNKKDANLVSYFDAMKEEKNATPLTYKKVMVPSQPADDDIAGFIDSTAHNIVFVNSYNDTLGLNLLRYASKHTHIKITTIALPFWESQTALGKPEYKDAALVYSTAFFKFATDSAVNTPALLGYKQLHKDISPTNHLYKSYTYTMRYGRLAAKYSQNIAGHLNELDRFENNKIDFQPFFNSKERVTLNYFENRKLYFIKKESGDIMAIEQ